VSVKLTEDPVKGSGSWMKMVDMEPVPYGKAAGSALCFRSSTEHMGLHTAEDMGIVMKIVFFFVKVPPPPHPPTHLPTHL
jgi:hypothetical protein